ncbi:MAG: tRNA adenosine(34) deaminase TadA [Acidobacteria bacterium]|nr:tRNA-specific adenosine deaminase [Pyrinomonadaceae bacterium]RIJ93018.1 MAG: tRNA adenosine(34) deaminase TadA [Acidobacteriota bacterium]
MDERDEEFLRRAIELARKAERRGEVPIGAVIVSEDGEILAEASNETIERHDPTAHAEILAIRRAGERIENYRLTGVTVYSTIEPCAMCAGALVNARVARLVYGAADERFGAVRSKFELCDSDKLNHRIEITAGGLEAECRKLMQDFFRLRRQKTEKGVST